jgi:16S rRNA processing protein RimM
MHFDDCFFLGTVVGIYSFKGEVLLKLDTDEPELYISLKILFLVKDKSLVPYFIEKCTMHKPGLLRIRFEDVNSEKDANQILKSKAYLPLSELPELDGNKFYYHEIINFTIIDKNLGIIGKVKSVNDLSPQATIEVLVGEEIALIPIVDSIILKVDRIEKSVLVNTPPGLLKIFL